MITNEDRKKLRDFVMENIPMDEVEVAGLIKAGGKLISKGSPTVAKKAVKSLTKGARTVIKRPKFLSV